MVRRLIAAGVAIVLIIVVVLLISGCLKSEKQQSLKTYNHEVSVLAQESEKQVAHPLFVALTNAAGKSALDVEQQIDELLTQARSLDNRAHGLSVPGEMAAAQQDLLLTSDFRVEAMAKLTTLVPATLGGKAKQTSPEIAGAMEIFLASDVSYSQRVVPLIKEALASAGITGLSTAPSRFLPNIGWLEPNTVASRLAGESSSQSTQTLSGHHGSALVGVSIGATKLEPEPAINHVSGGGNPTLTATVEDAGEFPEPNVKVDVTVTAGGKQYKASGVIPKTEQEKRANVEIPITGVPLGQAAKIEVQVEPVPGETNHEGTKATYLAIFGE
jgi:hypothetical protein